MFCSDPVFRRVLLLQLVSVVCYPVFRRVFQMEKCFVGTVADFAGSDPLIYRQPLRTEQYDLKQLNGKMPERLIFSSSLVLKCQL